jgi:hypothetical protein
MNPNRAKEEFEAFLSRRGSPPISLTPKKGVDAMLEFYRSIRADGCNMEEDGDMLLYQWGVYETSAGERFTYNITRQFILESGEDENFWQLGLTFAFPPTGELSALGCGDRWCTSLDELAGFEAFIRTHAATAAVSSRSDGRSTLIYDCLG